MFYNASGSKVNRQIYINCVVLYSQAILQKIDMNYDEIRWHLMTYQGKTYKTAFKTEAFLMRFWAILMVFKPENPCKAY